MFGEFEDGRLKGESIKIYEDGYIQAGKFENGELIKGGKIYKN